MQEAVKSQWSTRQLERQINSFFYERLLSSKDKEQVAAKIQTLEPAKKPEDVIRDPYVLEFLGLSSNDDFFESNLEQEDQYQATYADRVAEADEYLFKIEPAQINTMEMLFEAEKMEKLDADAEQRNETMLM